MYDRSDVYFSSICDLGVLHYGVSALRMHRRGKSKEFFWK